MIKLAENDQTSVTLVQKYLTVIEITSNTNPEMKEQSMMLVALTERLRGMAYALDYCGALDKPGGQTNTLSVLGLYPW
jgi:hypothetical protein